MALPVWVTLLANLRGPEGPPISQAQIDATVQGFLPDAVDAEIQSTGSGRLSDLGASVSEVSALTDLNLLPNASGWFRATTTSLNRPGSGTFNVLHLPYSASSAAQLAVPVSVGGEPSVWVRAKRADVWDAWVKLTTPADLNARVAGLVAELDLAVSLRSIHLESNPDRAWGSEWVWDGPAAPAATHHLIIDETGAPVARPTSFPIPSASAPALDW